jgi:hypothetical protein
MNKAILASSVLLVGSSAAWAVDVPLANGSFEVGNPPGFTQTISNWTASFFGPQQLAFAGPPAFYSGVFTSFGTKYVASTVPQGSAFAVLSNLGSGTVTLQSDAATLALPTIHNFAVADRNLAFRYAYLTNDPASAATHDQFIVHIDFFSSATETNVANRIGFVDKVVASSASKNDTGALINSFGGGNGGNNAVAVFNDSVGSGNNVFNLFNVDISGFFQPNTFARVSFIVDNNNGTQNVNGNGLGVSGVVLDAVVMNPEPSTVALFALGTLGLGGFAWRRRAAKKPTA